MATTMGKSEITIDVSEKVLNAIEITTTSAHIPLFIDEIVMTTTTMMKTMMMMTKIVVRKTPYAPRHFPNATRSMLKTAGGQTLSLVAGFRWLET